MYSVLTEINEAFFYGGDYSISTDVKNARSGTNAIAIDAHLDDVFFDIRFVTAVDVIGIECFM